MVVQVRWWLFVILVAAPACDETIDGKGCMTAPAEQSSCRSRDDVRPEDLWVAEPSCHDGTSYEIESVDGEGTRVQTSNLLGPREDCCYPVTIAVTDEDHGCAVE